jgi:AcrR family transcriptional regulator
MSAEGSSTANESRPPYGRQIDRPVSKEPQTVSTTARAQAGHRASARERLLAAANQLFYAEGVQTVGIDRIIDRAGVAKASLYNSFASKEELVAAYLAGRHEGTSSRLAEAMARFDDPRQKILAVFDAQAEQFNQPDFNGCAFIAASTEAPPGGLVERAAHQFRSWVRGIFTDLAAQLGAPDPVKLGRQLHLVYEGAGLAARMDHHDPAIAPSSRDAAEALLDAALARRDTRRARITAASRNAAAPVGTAARMKEASTVLDAPSA